MRGLAGRLATGVLVLLFLAGVVLSMLGSPSEPVKGSAASSEAGGRRALLLVLEELGLRAEAWRGAPSRLPRGETLLWMASAPLSFEPEEDEEQLRTLPEGGGELDPRAPGHVGDFVRAGGVLVLPASRKALTWLREDAGLPVPPWFRQELPQEPVEVELAGGERLSFVASSVGAVAREEGEPTDEAAPVTTWSPLAILPDGGLLAGAFDLGEGRVVLLADDSFLDNDRLGLEDHGLLAVRLVELLAPSGRVLLDEFALGRWLPTSRTELLASPGIREVALHLVILALLLAWLFGWVREFPRDPVLPPLDPRQRAQARAALLERAGAYDLLGRELRTGVLRRLAAAAGVRLLSRGEPRPVEEVLEALRKRHLDLRDDPHWSALLPRECSSSEDLEHLGASLTALERALARGSSRTPTT